MKTNNIIKKLKEVNLIKIVFLMAGIMFIMPSLNYMIKNKTVLGFDKEFKFLLNDVNSIKQTIIYLVVITILILIYFLIIKKRKELFKNIKSVMIFILIISSIFILTVPVFSSDIFYYLGIGRLSFEYGQNPYYVSMQQYINENPGLDLEKDTIMAQENNSYWAETTVVYGPIWTFICSVIAKLSLGNVDLGLLLFKLLNLLVHILNCYYIYKLSKKKVFVLLYGLNPFILIEGLVNVHNDIFMILFMLISFYYLIKKKNILLSIVFLALATCIKYFTIILLPFVIIYHFRKENAGIRTLKCIEYGLFFIMIIAIPYMFYIKDISVFAGIGAQQNKIAKSLCLVIQQYFAGYEDLVVYSLYAYIYFFIFKNIIFLYNKKVKLYKEMRSNFYMILIFLFVLITNFQPWYIMWLFPFIIWQKASNIKFIIQTSLISMYANSIFLIYGEYWIYGVYFYLILVAGMLIACVYNNKRKICKAICNLGGKLFG